MLYRDIQPRLVRYLRALVGEDAEDVASETWLQVARDLGGFQGSYDGFRGWVVTVGRHRALDHLRRERRRPPAVLVPAEDLAARAAADDTAAGALEAVSTDAAIRLIASLPRDQAEAVLLRAVVGLAGHHPMPCSAPAAAHPSRLHRVPADRATEPRVAGPCPQGPHEAVRITPRPAQACRGAPPAGTTRAGYWWRKSRSAPR